tara:strand:+ start:921 stop:1421 length:501 start_codon:yes stop_codon:yes gene_type:complete
MATLNYSNLQTELVKYGTLLVERYKAQLKIDGTQATGDTEKSLNYLVSDGSLEILADKSIEYLDKGREPGEAPPLSAIAQWARAKGIKPRGEGGSFIKSNSITEVWMIRNIAKSIAENGTIKRFGYKGSGIIDFVYQNNKEEMLNNIFAAYGRDVQEVLNEIAKEK